MEVGVGVTSGLLYFEYKTWQKLLNGIRGL